LQCFVRSAELMSMIVMRFALSVVLIFLNLISQKILHSKIIIKLLLKMDIAMISIAACYSLILLMEVKSSLMKITMIYVMYKETIKSY